MKVKGNSSVNACACGADGIPRFHVPLRLKIAAKLMALADARASEMTWGEQGVRMGFGKEYERYDGRKHGLKLVSLIALDLADALIAAHNETCGAD